MTKYGFSLYPEQKLLMAKDLWVDIYNFISNQDNYHPDNGFTFTEYHTEQLNEYQEKLHSDLL